MGPRLFEKAGVDEMILYCCECCCDVDAVLVTGKQVYPHRPDLYVLPFWRCNTCNNFVGCHHKTKNRTKPLGVIPTREIKKARMKIHAVIDPIWQSGKIPRGELYAKISEKLGYQYHTANMKSIEECNLVLRILNEYDY